MGIDRETLISELKKVTDSLKVAIIELAVSRGKNGLNIRVVVDRENGISLHDCERITRLYNDRLDVLDLTEGDNYTLQVSSPGIDRVFKDRSEYNHFKSRDVKIILKEPLDTGEKSTVLRGRLEGLVDDFIALDVDGRKLKIPLNRIRKTKLDG